MSSNIYNYAFFALVAGCLGLAACGTEQPAPPQPETKTEPAQEVPEEPTGTPVAVMDTNRGTITIELFPDAAPKTVEAFIQNAKSGFWYNTRFHRIIADTVIQGGDPNSKDNNPYNDGQGNSGRFLPAEFSKLPFERGTVAMARQLSDTNSASCQFFICLKRVESWDGKYTIFGKVIDGIKVVEEIANSPTSKDPALRDYPAGNFIIKRIKIEYRQ